MIALSRCWRRMWHLRAGTSSPRSSAAACCRHPLGSSSSGHSACYLCSDIRMEVMRCEATPRRLFTRHSLSTVPGTVLIVRSSVQAPPMAPALSHSLSAAHATPAVGRAALRVRRRRVPHRPADSCIERARFRERTSREGRQQRLARCTSHAPAVSRSRGRSPSRSGPSGPSGPSGARPALAPARHL